MSTYVPGISFSAFTDIRKPVLLAKHRFLKRGSMKKRYLEHPCRKTGGKPAEMGVVWTGDGRFSLSTGTSYHGKLK